jgi:polysaccharide export outer membrane protein
MLITLLSGTISCVSNKKIVYLQKDDLHKKNIITDTIVRTYTLQKFEYKLQPNDILYIDVKSLTQTEFDIFKKVNENAQNFSNPAMMSQGPGLLMIGYLVDYNGNIDFPIIGSIYLKDLTIFEAEAKLAAEMAKYVELPMVKIRIINNRITVLGEVNREGTVTLANNRVSMLEAIGLAGGFGELADRSRVKIIRQQGDSTMIFYLNILDENFFDSRFFYVHQNDVIIVPPLRQRPFRRYFGQNLSLFVSTLTTLILVITLTSR